MKKLFILVIALFAIPALVNAQILNPVHWNYSAKSMGNGQYILHLTANIDPGWHVYAQDAGEGPVPTSFKFDKSVETDFVGKVREVGKERKEFDKNFNSVLKFYENKVDFVQYVKVKAGTKSVKGSLEYMVCDNHQCLPPKDIDFSINL
ncbi:MAG: sugar transporter [Chitinophagaceae bacterium]|jgi:thiol:disulfide interchange protein DsbD|nr:MAG: sugar transporter [Chitinophagaceae bacterium]